MADRVGQQLGNYQLIRFLGEGGFAEVYLGEHIHLGTSAAIKVLHTQLTSEDVDKFRNEARMIARLVHPHIVRVLEFGVEGRTPFLVMDYAPNGTLRHRHSRGLILPLTTIVSYVRQIADALQYAHDEKLIHRDIKPENMLLGRRGEILLSDFGIALVAQSSRYQSTQDMAGTIAYMAPEQIQGKPRPASDQYALGVVVYEWLTGDRPFHGSFPEIAVQHTIVPPPPLHEKAPTILPDLEQVVLTALAKDPHQRYASVQAFARALEQATQGNAETIIKPLSSVVQQQPSATPSLSAPVVQTPQRTTPSELLPTMPVTLPHSPTQPTSAPTPVGTVISIYRGHTGKIRSVVWSPDSKHIVSSGEDKTVEIWDAATARVFATCGVHSQRVNAVAWSLDSRYIASGSDDKTVHVWDAPTGKTIQIFRVHSAQVNAIAWSSDSKRIASGSSDGQIHVWDAITGSLILTYQGHSGHSVRALAWSPDGRRIASGGINGIVQIWDAMTGNRVLTYQDHSGYSVRAVIWSFDGKQVASGSLDSTVQVWDTTTGKKVFTYHHRTPYAVAWSPSDSKRIASASSDGTVEVWDVTTGNKVFTYRHAAPVYAMA